MPVGMFRPSYITLETNLTEKAAYQEIIDRRHAIRFRPDRYKPCTTREP